MTATRRSATLGDVAGGVVDRLARTARAGGSMIGGLPLPRVHRSGCGCGCEVPAPCWVPRTLDEVTTPVCAGNTAVVRVTVTNCGFTTRTISAKSTSGAVDIEPASVTLGPLERATIVLSVAVPATSTEGEERRAIVWFRGCRDYVLPWTVETSCSNADCCRELAIDDCPDLVHHWYDHFYCDRGCRHEA
jgi:hypothetical protein